MKEIKQSQRVKIKGGAISDQVVRNTLSEEVSFIYLFFKFIYLFIYFWLSWVFVVARGAFSSCSERELPFAAVRGLLTEVVSLVEHGL